MKALIVGSVNIDLFLKTKDNDHTKITQSAVELQLGDKIPINVKSMSIGGNGANVSVGLSRLGIPTTFFSYIGSDILSMEIKEKMEQEKVSLVTDGDQKTATSFSLIFEFDNDRIIFSHHPVKNHDFSYKPVETINFLYLTSIGKNWSNAYEKVIALTDTLDIPLAFSPGSQQLEKIDELFFSVLKKSQFLFVNREEAEMILSHARKSANTITELLSQLQTLWTSIVSVTDGKNGAYAKNGDEQPLFIGIIEMLKPFEKTGAGDAYASGFIAAYLKNYPVATAMRWGMMNSHATMQKTGAQNGILNKSEMDKMLQDFEEILAKPIN